MCQASQSLNTILKAQFVCIGHAFQNRLLKRSACPGIRPMLDLSAPEMAFQ